MQSFLMGKRKEKMMSNSPLVKTVILSPNHSGERTMAIDRITPHCVVGHTSLTTLGNIFAPTSRKASSNYGIDDQGQVGMYVEERNRSWCSSSSANDQRAVTIEVASDTKAPYAITNGAWSGLVALCEDICKRNGKKKLIWIPDKQKALNYAPAADEMLLTVHRWFANKSCPGDYIYNRLGELATIVTRMLGGSAEISEEPTEKPQDGAKETTVDKMIWDFLKGHNLSDFAVAGIMGNLYAESGLRANNLQNSFEKKLGMSDEAYTAAVDNGSYTNFVKDSAGYGLAQWTYWSRKQALLNFAKAQGKSIGDIQMQLDYLWKELSGYKGVMTQLKNAKSVLEASNAILTGYEKPADQGAAVQKKRAGYGQTFYDHYAEGFKPYTVKVTASALNVRKGAGTSYPVTTVIRDKGIYTIVEETKVGNNTWGRLKSGAGWICLYYTKKV